LENNSRLITPPDYDLTSTNPRALLVCPQYHTLLNLVADMESSSADWDIYICSDAARFRKWAAIIAPAMHKILIDDTVPVKVHKKIQENKNFVKYSTYSQLKKELSL
jgi:hypothetical protein